MKYMQNLIQQVFYLHLFAYDYKVRGRGPKKHEIYKFLNASYLHRMTEDIWKSKMILNIYLKSVNIAPKTRLSPSFAGAAKLIGFVPNAAALLRVGQSMGEVFVIEMPIKPCSSAYIECHPAIPLG